MFVCYYDSLSADNASPRARAEAQRAADNASGASGGAAADVAAEGEGCFDFTWSRGFFGDIRQITSWASMELVRGEGGNRNRRGMVA